VSLTREGLFSVNCELSISFLFAAWCYASAAYAVMRCPSVCQSARLFVCLSRSWILSKRINISSFFSPSGIATQFWFFRTKNYGNIPTESPPPNHGVECRWTMLKSRFWTNSWRSIDDAVQTTTAKVDGAVYRTERHASMNLCLSQPAWWTTTKRKE